LRQTARPDGSVRDSSQHDPLKDLDLADILGVDELSAEQLLDHSVLHPVKGREPDEPVGLDRIGDFLDAVETEFELLLYASRGYTGFEFPRTGDTAKLPGR